MEFIYSREFTFKNRSELWESIYKQKLAQIKMKKLREFNYKMLHNIVPNEIIVSKWDKSAKSMCQMCYTNE